MNGYPGGADESVYPSTLSCKLVLITLDSRELRSVMDCGSFEHSCFPKVDLRRSASKSR